MVSPETVEERRDKDNKNTQKENESAEFELYLTRDYRYDTVMFLPADIRYNCFQINRCSKPFF